MKLAIRLLCTWAAFSVADALTLKSSAKPIDVSGRHAFVPPDFSAGDIRGPCPGLNALANHGYIPHNGVTSLVEVVAAITTVYGMGLDLATILGVMGTVWVGNPLSLNPGFSIGGPTKASANILGNVFGLTGTPQGLNGSHNWIEADSSNTRADLYVTGDASTLQMDMFLEWYNMSPDAIGNFSLETAATRASIRFQQSVAQNPYFYYGPFTGLIARNAGYIFASRLFANYSSEHPEGILTKATIRSFYSIYPSTLPSEAAAAAALTYLPGHERIPPNWYRRPSPSGYTLAALNLDILAFIRAYPQLSSIGGNTGTVNSFTGLEIGNLTGGVYSAETLLQGNNLVCLALQVVKTVSPDLVQRVWGVVDGPLGMVVGALQAPLLGLGCPALGDLSQGGKGWEEVVKGRFPGAGRSGGGL